MVPSTGCDLRAHPKILFGPVMLVLTVLAVALVAGLALAKTHIRFRTRDLQIETLRLQQARAQLGNRQKKLVSEVEKMKDWGWLKQYAETVLGLRECPLERTRRAVLSPEAVRRWRGTGSWGKGESSRPVARNLLVAMSERLVSFSRKSARKVAQR